MSPGPAEEKITTYVFVGYGISASELAAFERRQDCKTIRPRAGESFKEAVERANIKVPANVILSAHGGEDQIFEWREGELLSYRDFFEPLPEGIEAIGTSACFGGLALESLKYAPKGAFVFTLVSGSNIGLSSPAVAFADEVKKTWIR